MMKLLTKAEKSQIKRNKAIVLFGPTAVGKTDLTLSLFSKNCEIINADSVQVYKGLDISSAKPDKRTQELIPHHLVDIREPWEQFTSGDFCNEAERLIEEINERGRVPLLSGGTAYYFKQLCYGKSEAPASDPVIREKVKKLIEENGTSWARKELERVDPLSYARINENDIYRISRALEVYYQVKLPLSSFTLSSLPRTDIDFVYIGLYRPFEELKTRIKNRVDIMFDMGAREEISMLLSLGAKKEWPSMQAIGYKEWFEALESGEYSISLLKERIVNASIKYAKRQMTFFKSFEKVKWFEAEDTTSIKEEVENTLSIYL